MKTLRGTPSLEHGRIGERAVECRPGLFNKIDIDYFKEQPDNLLVRFRPDGSIRTIGLSIAENSFFNVVSFLLPKTSFIILTMTSPR